MISIIGCFAKLIDDPVRRGFPEGDEMTKFKTVLVALGVLAAQV